jgi:Ca2+-binding EF-hand superfamily protein
VKCILSLGALLAVAALASGVQAGPPAGYDVSAAFAEADVNKDGSVEINEYFDRLVETYFHADTDKNGTLSKEEFVKAVVIEEDFAKVDIDSNGVVDRREFVRSRLPLFQASDTDHDGGLSLAEVRAALEKGNDP